MQSPVDKKEENAATQAQAQLESIREMVKALREADESGDDAALEAAETTIREDALDVQVRSGWYSPGGTDDEKKPQEFTILLCTGGPAVRIIGELDQYGQPETARIEHQDWFTPWTNYHLHMATDEEILLTYCRQFYFSE
jgi:hypothetical protein